MMDTHVAEKLADWRRWDKNPTTLAEIETIAAADSATLAQRLCGRLTFGTAGLRGVMRAGFASMNDLVIIQTAQGLCAHVCATYPAAADRQRGICIGYDGRHNSHRFAQLTAATFIRAGLPVHLFGRMVATPFVPYAISQLGCLAGVMVTASHNPKEDNGYKVYWSNGAQIIGPHDKAIERSIEAHLQPLPGAWNLDILSDSNLLHDPLDELSDQYYAGVLATIPAELVTSNRNNTSGLRFVYTAMHGVGYVYVRDAFAAAGLAAVLAVPEQRDADPDFPTVRFPNPEEGASALELSTRLADAEGVDAILANDPDADRLAFAERCPLDGTWKVFTGNELGAVLGWWAWKMFGRTKAGKGVAADDCVMLCSTVSSMVLRSLAKKEGFRFEDTLTGFKWMGNRAVELREQGKRVVFAFEEAIGFMVGTEVLDKDGVSAAVHLATMATWLRSDEGGRKTVAQKVWEVYEEYGFHYTVNSYYICHEKEVIDAIFGRIRAWNGEEGRYPRTLSAGKYTIASVRDLTTGHDSAQPDGRAVLPTSRSSHMITFAFTNGVMLTLRTSGTEPKVKYYTEICAAPEEKDWASLRVTLISMMADVDDELFQPELNGLIPRG